jgi:hypothetical protein
MESNQQINPPLKENSPGPNEITIMIMGSIGKIHSFTVSRRVLVWLSILLLIYILISLFIISRYIGISSSFRSQSVSLDEAKEKYEQMDKDLLKAQQRAANLEAYIESTGKHMEEGGTTVRMQPGSAPDRTVIDTAGGGSEQAKRSVDVEGWDIRQLNSGVVIDFRLVNITSGVGAVEGYMHILVSDRNNNFPSTWNAPSKEVRNGVPAEFRTGEHFIIQRFKQYHREFTSGSSFGPPSHIRILAYDSSGNLILEKEYEVNNVS